MDCTNYVFGYNDDDAGIGADGSYNNGPVDSAADSGSSAVPEVSRIMTSNDRGRTS